jgi:hypothetical protein
MASPVAIPASAQRDPRRAVDRGPPRHSLTDDCLPRWRPANTNLWS